MTTRLESKLFEDFKCAICKVGSNSINLINWMHDQGISNIEYMILDSGFKQMNLTSLHVTLLILPDKYISYINRLTELLKQYHSEINQ